MKDWGFLAHSRYQLHDRDGKFCPVCREVIQAGKVRPLKLTARSPNLNGFAERWVRSVKEECLSRLIFFGEHSLRRALTEYIDHFHRERNHQGKGNRLLFPTPPGPVQDCRWRTVQCKEPTRWLTAILPGPSSMNTGSDYYFDRTGWFSSRG